MTSHTVALTCAATLALGAGALAQALEAPILLEAGGSPINVEIGHAAPYVYDFDGDGVRDLLVGQFGDGQLRVYRNEGSDEKPVYGEFAWFEAGGTTGSVPAG